MRSFTELYKKNFEIKNDYNLRMNFMHTNLSLFGCFWKVLSLICFGNDLYTLYNQLTASRLTQVYRKTWKHMNRGKTQCWAHFLISTATFRKTAIKLKFDDRFSLNKISVLQSINRGGESPVCWLLTYIITRWNGYPETLVSSFCESWSVSACAYARLRLSKQDSGKMFSDLALVILALFVFVWGCMMLERRNNNSGERKSTGKLRKRKRVARSHWEDPHYMTQRKPEENTDDESYNMHWRIFRWDFLILIP